MKCKAPAFDSLPETLAVVERLPRLCSMKRPPREAYLWGKLPPGPWVAIVGTRRPSRAGVGAARQIARELAQQGVTILSGGALGIDSAAHEGALQAGGKTVVVAPAWLSNAYPTENHALFRRILRAGGGYLSLAEEGVHPLQPAFFRRNEALMALAHAAVLGDCPLRSGARNAMTQARRLGRPRFCLPWHYGHAAGFGMEQEVLLGARMLSGPRVIVDFLVQTGAHDNPVWWDALRALELGRERGMGTAPRAGLARPIQSPELGTRQATARVAGSADVPDGPSCPVARAIWGGAGTVEAIVTETGKNPAEVQHRVLILTLEGEVFEDERGILRYHFAPHEQP